MARTPKPKPPTRDDLIAQLATANEINARMQQQWQEDRNHNQAEQKRALDHIKGLETDNNALRDKLMTAYLDAERFRGYLDGQADMQPPVMVPQEREQRGPYRNRPWNEDTMPSSTAPRIASGTRAWYHR